MPAFNPSARINMRGASVMVVDSNQQALDVMRQTLMGFGVRAVYGFEAAEPAKALFAERSLDLIIIDPLMDERKGFDLLRWMRREESTTNHAAPVIAAIGHNTMANVAASRDAGANFVVAKPLSPETLLQRIEWIARENRQFVIAPNYAGPDRRFKNEGPPAGMEGRRSGDLPLDVPDAAEPNMSQFEVDELLKPRKVML